MPTSFPVDSNSTGVSVAQGGRIVAVGANYSSNTTKVYRQTGVLVGTVPNVWRREYLEKDTVDYFYDFTFGGINSMSLRRQNGTASFFKLDSLAEPGRFGANIVNARVSPDGAWVATRGQYSLINGPICVPVGTPAQAVRPYARTHLIRLADGASQLLRSDDLYSLPCVPVSNASIDWSDVPVWRPDAAHFLLLVAIAQYNGGTLTGWNDLTLERTAAAPTAIVSSGTQSGLWHFEGWLPADGSYLRSLSSTFNGGSFLSVSVTQRPIAPFMVVSQIAQQPWQLVPLRRGGESASSVQRPGGLLRNSYGPFDRLMPGGPTRIIAN
jgi:hypothetical protein